MVRFGLSRAQRDIFTTASQTLADLEHGSPSAGKVIFEIGVVLTLHLAFAAVVAVALGAYGLI